jgi:hypothetical protein
MHLVEIGGTDHPLFPKKEDSDEILNVSNPIWKHYQEIQRQWNKKQQKQQQQQQQQQHRNQDFLPSMTVLDFLQRLQGHSQTQQPCIPVPRLLFIAKEEVREEIGDVINQPPVPLLFYLDGTDRDQRLPSRDLWKHCRRHRRWYNSRIL